MQKNTINMPICTVALAAAIPKLDLFISLVGAFSSSFLVNKALTVSTGLSVNTILVQTGIDIPTNLGTHHILA